MGKNLALLVSGLLSKVLEFMFKGTMHHQVQIWLLEVLLSSMHLTATAFLRRNRDVMSKGVTCLVELIIGTLLKPVWGLEIR